MVTFRALLAHKIDWRMLLSLSIVLLICRTAASSWWSAATGTRCCCFTLSGVGQSPTMFLWTSGSASTRPSSRKAFWIRLQPCWPFFPRPCATQVLRRYLSFYLRFLCLLAGIRTHDHLLLSLHSPQSFIPRMLQQLHYLWLVRNMWSCLRWQILAPRNNQGEENLWQKMIQLLFKSYRNYNWMLPKVIN